MEEAPAGAVNARAEKLLEAWTSDIGFVIDHLNTAEWFAGKPDLNRVGVFGHSFGGAQAAQFCSQDPRCKAGIDIDGLLVGPVIQTGIHTPFMFLLSDHSHESDPEAGRVMADIQSVYERVPAGERLRVMIRGALHYTFSDDGALLKSRLMRGVLRALGMLSIDGPRHLEVTEYCVRTFFDAYLKGGSPPKLGTARYPQRIFRWYRGTSAVPNAHEFLDRCFRMNVRERRELVAECAQLPWILLSRDSAGERLNQLVRLGRWHVWSHPDKRGREHLELIDVRNDCGCGSLERLRAGSGGHGVKTHGQVRDFVRCHAGLNLMSDGRGGHIVIFRGGLIAKGKQT